MLSSSTQIQAYQLVIQQVLIFRAACPVSILARRAIGSTLRGVRLPRRLANRIATVRPVLLIAISRRPPLLLPARRHATSKDVPVLMGMGLQQPALAAAEALVILRKSILVWTPVAFARFPGPLRPRKRAGTWPLAGAWSRLAVAASPTPSSYFMMKDVEVP